MTLLSPVDRERYLHWFFEFGLALKTIFAAGEIAAAVAAYVTTPALLSRFVSAITRAELAEDPHDFIADHLVEWAQHLSFGTQRFMALYLLSHGVIKLWLISGLIRRRLWYYPVALAVFGLFVVYQLYRFSFTHAAWLLLVTAVDLVVIALTWHEYRHLRALEAAR